MTTALTPPPTAPAPVPGRRAKQRPPLPSATALLLRLVLAFTALAGWSVAYPLVVGPVQEHDRQEQLFDRFREELSQATAPVGPTAYGAPVALVTADALGLRDAVVVEGTSSADLRSGPGHLRSSVLPGQAGTAVLLGKAATFGAPFGRLADLRPGDTVTTTTGQGVFTYTVDRLRRPGDPLPSPPAAGTGRLVLVSAEGSGWRSGFAPTSVLYVDATLKGEAQPSPGGLPAVTAAEKPMGTTTEPLLPLVFWLQGLLVVALAAVWLAARWGRWQAWAVGLPVLLALSVGASRSAAALLPNLL